MLARLLFDDGKTLDDFDAGRYEIRWEEWSSSTTSVDLGEFTFRVGRREHRRIFTKMAVSLLGCFDEGAARSTYLRASVDFARHDHGDISYWAEAGSPGSGLLDERQLPGFVHAIEVWTCEGKLLVKVRLFGRLCFTAVLSAWPRNPLSVAYAVDSLL